MQVWVKNAKRGDGEELETIETNELEATVEKCESLGYVRIEETEEGLDISRANAEEAIQKLELAEQAQKKRVTDKKSKAA